MFHEKIDDLSCKIDSLSSSFIIHISIIIIHLLNLFTIKVTSTFLPQSQHKIYNIERKMKYFKSIDVGEI